MIATEEQTKTTRYLRDQEFRNDANNPLPVAYDTVLNTNVVLRETPIRMNKVMSIGQQDALRAGFAEKAQVLTAIKHESIQRVLDFYTEVDRHCLVLEAIAGSDLAELLEKKREAFPLHDIMNWADQLLDALHYLHTYVPPIFHGDIKPQNLKLTPGGKLKLLGLGARLDSEPSAETADADLSYRPLEQIWSGLDAASQKVITNSYDDRSERLLRMPLDPRSDIYSVGATLYQLLTGCRPVNALERSIDTLEGKHDPLRSPSELDRGVPEEISEVLLKALELKREHRFDSAVIMRQVLRTALIRVRERESVEAVEQEKMNAAWEASLAEEDTLKAQAPVAEPVHYDLESAEEKGQIEQQMKIDLDAERQKQELEEQMRSDHEAEQARQIEEQMWNDLEAERSRVEETRRIAKQKRQEEEAEEKRREEESRLLAEQKRLKEEAEEARRELEKLKAETESLKALEELRAEATLAVQEFDTVAYSETALPIAAIAKTAEPDDDILEIPPAAPRKPRPDEADEDIFAAHQEKSGSRWLIPAVAFALIVVGGAFFGLRSFMSSSAGVSTQPAAPSASVSTENPSGPAVQGVVPQTNESAPANVQPADTQVNSTSPETPAGPSGVKNKPAAAQPQPQPQDKKPAVAPAKTPAPKKPVTVDDLIRDN